MLSLTQLSSLLNQLHGNLAIIITSQKLRCRSDSYLENCYQCPEQVVKISPCCGLDPILTREHILASKEVHSQDTGREYKEYQQS